MVKNVRGGNKTKKQKNMSSYFSSRALRIKNSDSNSGELYGQIVKKLGGHPPKLHIICEDNIERCCIIRGKFVNRTWMNPGDLVIILIDKNNNSLTGEVTYKYEQHEISDLDKLGELKKCKFIKNNNNNDEVDFTELTIEPNSNNEESVTMDVANKI